MHARGFTGADACPHFCFAAAVEERRIGWLDARDDGLARDDAVAGFQFDASHVSGQGRRHDEHVADTGLAVVADADLQRAASDRRQVDGHGLRAEEPRNHARERDEGG